MNRLVLSEDQSAFIRESGIKFAVVHPGSYPANVGRYVLDLIPCDYQRAVDAIAVATGEARATRPRVTTPAIATDASQGHPEAGKQASC
jgi:hypothetical protein